MSDPHSVAKDPLEPALKVPLHPLSTATEPRKRENVLPLLSSKRAISAESVKRTVEKHEPHPKKVRHDPKDRPHNTSNADAALSQYPTIRQHFRTPNGGATQWREEEDVEAQPATKPNHGPAGSGPLSKMPSRSTKQDTGLALPAPWESSQRLETKNGSQLLNSVHITEFLDEDDRLALIIDLVDDKNYSSATLQLLYINTSLKARPVILAHILGKSDDPTLMLDTNTSFNDFKSWVLTSASHADECDQQKRYCDYAGLTWQHHTVRRRIRVVTANTQLTSRHEQDLKQRPRLQHYQGLTSSSSKVQSQSKSESPTYFDRKTRNAHLEIPQHVEALLIDSFPDTSSWSPPEDTTAPLANGEAPIEDPIPNLHTPGTEQGTMPVRNNDEGFEPMSLGSYSDQEFFDWTRLPQSASLPQHVRFARGVNWAATSLGPIETWSADLRGMCNLIMASPHPAAMYWGKDHVAIYNEAYILLAGQKHPSLMGKRYADAWSEIWEALEEVFVNAHSHAQATMKDDDCLFLIRNGYLEETYFSWSLIPLIGENGTVVGTYNPAFEKTRRKIAERRMLTLREVGEKTAAARLVSQFWGLVLKGLEYNEYDAPLVMVYSLQDDVPDNDTASATSSNPTLSKICCLEGALGVAPEHPAAPTRIELRSGTGGFGAAFRRALYKSKPIVLSEKDGTLDISLFEGMEWRGFGDPARTVVVAPIQPTTGESTLGFLVMAMNPRRPYDEDYDLFVQLLGRQLATSVASVVLFEEEIRKGEEAARMAAQDRIELSNQLVARTQEAVESENKFARMAELAPVGIYIGDAEGKLVYVNDHWYDMSSFPRGLPVGNDWLDCVVPEDKEKAHQSWNMMLAQKIPVSIEFRFKTSWKDSAGNTGPTWVLASASPDTDENGEILRVFGSVTNISSQKSAEELQTRRMKEAVEMKRQQTNFIDITSHEMRNPLGAILLSSDEIISSLTELIETPGLPKEQKQIIHENIDAAQTITLCAQHQKRIVDDVLTLSKLDSAVLLVTPIDAQPLAVIQRALRIFESEIQSADIVLELRVDSSYRECDIDWVRMDPFRLSQVLINLTTNAIKFTTTQERRTILVHLAASPERPSKEDKWGLRYIPTRSSKTRDITAASEWGTGEPIYIHFAVQDTGRGLTNTEKERLFQRFSQANPRTHVTYGGSGLGLFICRELVELQGGEIGVASQSGKGSTFAFYVKARRSSAPRGSADEPVAEYTGPRKVRAKSGGQKRITKPGPELASQNSDDGTHQIASQDSVGPGSTTQVGPRTPSSSSSSSSTRPLFQPVHARPQNEQLKILIVEDNLINQKVLANQLKKLGCEVSVANHGAEALQIIESSNFHRDGDKTVQISVVLMDLEMPVMDGMTCVRQIRKLQALGHIVQHVPVVAVTANAREEQLQACYEAGMDGIISKPFTVKEMMAKIVEIVTKPKTKTVSSVPVPDSTHGGSLPNEGDM